MFISQVQRQFGRNISNLAENRKRGKHSQRVNSPIKKRSIPRAPASYSVRTDNATSLVPTASRDTENIPPKNHDESTKQMPTLKREEPRRPLQTIEIIDDSGDESMMDVDDMESPVEVEDIDALDAENPQFVTEYVNDIFAFLKEKELAVQIPPDYMNTFQTDLESRHREILVNWICEVYLQLRLLSESLFLTVNIVDRLLSCRVVTKRKLHLVGIGALMIATKFEETYAPPLSDLRICSENAYSEEEMLRVERVILNALDFNLCIPSPLQFLRRYSKAAGSDSYTHTLSKYITELSVTSYDMLEFLPSHIAVASVVLARRMRNQEPAWCPQLLHYAEVNRATIMPCARQLNQVVIRASRKAKDAIYRKYADSRLLSVSHCSPVPFEDCE